MADLGRAATDGILSNSDVERLTSWATTQRSQPGESQPAIEYRKGFNLVRVLYYFGAMLMISACAWFLGDKWDLLGAGGIFMTAIIYAVIAAIIGIWLRRDSYPVAGGLLMTVTVSLTHVIVYSIERMTGLWL